MASSSPIAQRRNRPPVKIAAELKAKGTYFADTPMTTPKAEAKLGLMVAAPDILAKIRPVLDCFADAM
jgi:3-hydroxyisobutyrate dehydrogenase-like beta-hydroxyacid dehydrogenase